MAGGNKTVDLITKVVISVLSAAIVGLFVWIWNAQTKLTLLTEKVSSLTADHSADVRQDAQLNKHWKLHNWARHSINELERKQNMPLSEWPDLGVKP